MIADDRDDADDLRCNASDRIAGLQDRLTCDLRKRTSFGISLACLYVCFLHFVVQVCWMIADD